MLTQSVFRKTRVECFMGICSRNISHYRRSGFRNIAFIYVRHRIKSAPRKRTAASQPFQRQHNAAPRSVSRNCFLSVLRAGRIKFASASENRRKKSPIKLHKRERNPSAPRWPFRCQALGTARHYDLRGTSFTSSAASGENSAVAAVLRG
jgi:hypothetical protein